MAHFDCIVDTQPMAREIESVSRHINGTTTAVVGMKAAIIKAENDAADHVCNNVNRGFYALIHSQISQKMAHLQSDVDSHLMQLNQQRKQLMAIKNRMERDYGLLTARYTKLFTSINKNLQQRVYELDKPTMNLAVTNCNTMTNRTMQLTATVPVAQVELLATSQRIATSNMKNRCTMVVQSINSFLSQLREQELLTSRILLPDMSEKDVSSIMVPVIISESNYDSFNHTSKNVAVNEESLTPSSREAIRKGVYESSLEWVDAEQTDEMVKSEFLRCVAESSASQRVKEMAQKLFMSNNYKTLKD